MTFPPGAHGGAGRPPLDGAANAVLASARARLGGNRPPYPPAPPKALSAEQAAEALDVIGSGGGCPLCGGIHPAEDHGCPRLASFRLDGDGKITEGTFWRDGEWDRSGVLFADDAAEEGSDGARPE